MNGLYQATEEFGTPCVIRRWPYASTNSFVNPRGYSMADCDALADWLNERAAGYPPSRELVENPRF